MGEPVWLLASNFEPRGRSLYTLRLALNLPAQGFDPTILCESAERIPRRLREKLAFREIPSLGSPLWRSWNVRALTRDAALGRPVLIHTHWRGFDALALELASRVDCPYLLTLHEPLPSDTTLSVLLDRLGAIITVSPSVKQDLIFRTQLPTEFVEVIPSGVELPAIPLLPAPRSAGQVPVVGAAGPLEPVKGFVYFLLAAELILSSGHDVEFVIAGTGPEEEVLRRAARHLEIANRVTFVTHPYGFGEVLEAIDVFVMPSLEQGLGTLMLEAMALGKPVVASRVGGIADFFTDAEHALLVPKANPVVLAERIQYTLDNPDKARRMAAAGQQLVRQQFSVEQMTLRTVELYRRILA